MKRFLFPILIFLFCSYQGLYAQSGTKETQIEKNLKRSKELIQKNLDSAIYFSEKALLLSQTIDNDTLLAKAFLQKSSVLINKGGFAEADSILKFNLDKKLPPHLEGQKWHNLGTIQYYKQDLKKALDIYLKAAQILEKAKNSTQIAGTYANIGTINASLKNFDNAMDYLEKALPLSDHNEILRLQVLVNLCGLYLDRKLLKKYKENIFKAEKLAEKYKVKRMLSIIYNSLSNYYTDNAPDYRKAITYGNKSIVLKKELNLTKTLGINYNNLGNSYLKSKEFKKAIKYLDSALPLAQGTLKSYIYNNLKDSYSGLKDFKTAIYYANLKDNLKDSITNEKEKEKVAELIEKFESEKKQQQINILDTKNQLQTLTIKQQKYLLGGIAIFGMFILILGYFGFRNYKTKQQLDTVLLQQRLLKTQLNPHFLFNALQSIQNFIYQNDKEKSSSYLASYSKLIRLILEKSDEDFISVADDKLALESYLNLQRLNQNNSFDYEITIDNIPDDDFEMLPSLVTQPFVENAVLHGLKDVDKGYITVRYFKDLDDLFISIKDNGKGFEEKKQDSKKLHKSMSMRIIKEQFKNLSKTSKNFKGVITINPSTLGTEILLRFTTTKK